MADLKALLGVARAPFLLLPVTLVASGTAAAAFAGGWDALHSLTALVGLVALHVAVNAFNEASDYRTGIDLNTRRTPFTGGSGTLPSGAATPRFAVVVAVAGSLVGLAVGLYFFRLYGSRFLPFLLLGALAVLAYSDLLGRIGLGEAFAGLGLGALPVLGAALVQHGEIGPAAVAAAVPAFLMTFDLLLLNEFPDEQADRGGGRRHLVLLLGRRGAAIVYAVAALGVPLSIAVAVGTGVLPWPCLVALVPSLALAKPLGWAFRRPEQPVPIPALGANVAWNLATNTALAVGLVLAIWLRP